MISAAKVIRERSSQDRVARDYAMIVLEVQDAGDLSANALSRLLGRGLNNVNQKMRFLCSVGILSRETTPASERYRYSIAKGVDLSGLTAFVDGEGSESVGGERLAMLLAEKMPPFNPSWGPSVSREWFIAMAKIASIAS